MKLRYFNFILALAALMLLINLFFPLGKIFSDNNFENIRCNINGNEIIDAHLCCSEMAKFLSCKNGICDGENYDILSMGDTLKYCEKNGYNVRF